MRYHELLHETDQTQTAEFKRWFGKSKVVDAQGRPLVVYHGTNKPDFDTFKLPGARGSGGNALFFAFKPATAGYFTHNADRSRILPVYVRLEHPFDFENENDLAKLGVFLRKNFQTLFPGALYNVDTALGWLRQGDFNILEKPRVRRWMRNHGYDGYWVMENNGKPTLAVFSPSQVKSAISNSGLFNPDDPRIHEAKNVMMTDTPAFKRWFQGSQVVDARGKPLRVYHGTSHNIEAFDSETSSTPHGMMFFSTNAEFSSRYAGTEGGNVIPCYLRIIDLFDYRTDWELAYDFYHETGGINDSTDAEHIRIALHGREDVEDDQNPLIHDDEMDADEFASAVQQGFYPALESYEFVQWLRQRHRVDGILMLEVGSINYAIFSPNQVKSAISNSGDFDPNSDNISEDHQSYS